MIEIICSKCEERVEDLTQWKCNSCNSPLKFDLNLPFDKRRINYSYNSLWRFKDYLCPSKIISLGEGNTPLVKLNKECYLKLDYLNPTGSFKDRGASCMLSFLYKKIKDKIIVEDSSGNAGASIACYSSRANIKCKIFVPEDISPQKERQIRVFKAKLIKVRASREEIMEKAIEEANKKDHFYASHVWNPFFLLGNTTLAFELLKYLKEVDRIFLPVSAGTLLLGLIYGLEKLLKDGIINKFPKIVACQVEEVSPLYHALKGLPYNPPKRVKTIADALISTKPVRLKEMVDALKRIGGDCIIANDREILKAQRELAKRGFFVEPSSALAFACYKKLKGYGKNIIILTGHGLKTYK
ncbi:Threonine synthase [archaeon HR06]|nr:Threonine synthase [archaeon HR06]